MKNFYAFIICLLVVVSLNGQTVLNLNESSLTFPQELSEAQRQANPWFDDGERVRPFYLNQLLFETEDRQTGEQWLFELFPEISYEGILVKKTTWIEGITTYRFELQTTPKSYAQIAVGTNDYLFTLNDHENNLRFNSRSTQGTNTNYLFLLNPDVGTDPCGLDDTLSGFLPDGVSPGGNSMLSDGCFPSPGPNDPAIINVMVLYTSSAEAWAATNQGGITNTISVAMDDADLVASNSNLNLTFNLVHQAQVSYTEAGSSTDLGRLRGYDDGFMDDVHLMRGQFEADLVALLTNYVGDGIGGIANLPNTRYGNPRTGFSVTKVYQATSIYTFIHELGHNLSANHHKFQSSGPGPTNFVDWPENTWTGGWRWQGSDTNYYASVMTYLSPSEFPDGEPTTGLPYFSDPTQSHLGAPMGHAVDGDNTRTLKTTKHAIARYRDAARYCPADVGNPTALFIQEVNLDNHIHATSFSLFSDFSAIEACLQPGASLPVTVTANNTYAFNRVAIWVDWNDDGEFSMEENVYRATSGGQVFSTSIMVPLNVTPGPKRMRIRLYDPTTGGTTNDSPCGFASFGELEDYTIQVEEPDPCLAEASVQNIQISNIGVSSASVNWDPLTGVSQYDLRYRETGAPVWIEVSPLYVNTHTLTGLAFDTEHEVQVRAVCNSTSSIYSSSILFTTSGYCQASYGGVLTITRVRVGDIDQASSGGTGYSDFTNISTDLERGRTYSIKINNNTGGNYMMGYAAYIDYNYNGSFDLPLELVWSQAGAIGSEVTGQFTIPMDASLDSSRLRIVMSYTNNTTTIPQPCTVAGSSGEVEDYTVNITPYAPCAVAQIPVNLTASNITESQATLSWDEVLGADYDLRYKETGAVDWVEINGFFENTITLQSLNNNTEYEAQVRSVCDGTPGTYSPSLIFTTENYCGSQGGSNWNITNVTFNDINNSSPGTSQSDTYTDFTNIIGTVNQFFSYDLSITSTGGIENVKSYRVWIDFNQDGIFEASELVFDQQTASASVSESVTIPGDALLGNTRMRVSYKWASTGQGPCESFGFGEVEDYTINLLEFVPCETAAVPENFSMLTLSDTEATLGWDVQSGAAFELRYRELGAPVWIDVTETFTNLITLESLTPVTVYEAQVRSKCDELTVSDYTSSLVFETFATPPVYCAAGSTQTSNEKISNVTFNTINNNSTATVGYEDFTHISTTVEKGETYSFSSTISNIWVSDQVIVWIDFNQNGDFTDPGEQVLLINNTAGSPMTGSFTIPSDAMNGPTRMRVRLHDANSGPMTAPCGNSTWGQVEDYTVIIAPSGFVFQNGSWSPQGPEGMSTAADDIHVLNGSIALSNDVVANNLFIQSGATLQTRHIMSLNGNIENDGLLLIKSNALSTGQLNTFNGIINGVGEVTIERFIPARRAFRLLSTAVTTSGTIRDNWQEGQNNPNTSTNNNDVPGFGTHITGSTSGANGFDATPSGNPSLFTLNNTGQTWEAVENTDLNTIAAGTAYRMLVRGDRSIDVTSNSAVPTNTTLRTTGTLHTGAFIVSDLSGTENAYNFIGNPYPAAVDMNQVLNAATNMNSVHYWVWDPTLGGIPTPGQPGGRGAYVAVNVIDNTSNNGSSQANRYLQPGQAAFVQTAGNGATAMSFQEQYKAVDQPQTQVFNVLSSIRMKLYDAGSFANSSTSSDGLLLKFSEEGSNEVTFEDAMKFYNQDENLASVNSETLLSIESRALPEVGETIPLFTNQYRKTNYVFEASLSEMNEILVFLKDYYTGALTELFNNETTLYAFQVDPTIAESMADDRFEIVFEEMLSTDEVSFGDGFVLFPNPTNGSFTIATRHIQGDIVNLTVSSITGQKVYSNTLTVPSNGQLVIEIPGLSAGLYMVELVHPQGGLFTSKLVKK